jgi:hypothetical protein
VMPISMRLSWMMFPTTPQQSRAVLRGAHRGTTRKTGSHSAGGLRSRTHRNGSEGYGALMLFSGVTRLLRGAAVAQVWMDHICCRPATASAFRLTLKDGAEPSLGAPGPE